jgi:glycosyltransferase involved in cell wall biosynthesis
MKSIPGQIQDGVQRLRRALLTTSVAVVERTKGGRILERRTSLCGVPIWRKRSKREKYRVALLVDEFFGGWDTAIGGYGALARKYVCRYIPDDALQIDVLLDVHPGSGVLSAVVDATELYRLPVDVHERQRWLEERAYDAFLSIEMTYPSFVIFKQFRSRTPLLFWVQDPRELGMYQSRLATVNKLRDSDWAYVDEVADLIADLVAESRICFISQGPSLSEIARRAYRLPQSVEITDLPNPVEIDFNYRADDGREANSVVFVGRLEAQKRVWIVCEIAKAMPHYEFYIVGATGQGRNEAENAKTLAPYRNADGTSKIRNLHFLGHLDGEKKHSYFKKAKLLINTSIWEGIPVTWLEALSYGTLIVSAFDRDEIISRFGTFVGEVSGDGTDAASISRFAKAIEGWMADEPRRLDVAQAAINFVRTRHAIPSFVRNTRNKLFDLCLRRPR